MSKYNGKESFSDFYNEDFFFLTAGINTPTSNGRRCMNSYNWETGGKIYLDR